MFRKCLAEEIRKGVLVTGDYTVTEMAGQQVNLMVTDTKGHHLLNREKVDAEGKFAFTTDTDDIFEICFISRVPSNMRGGRHEIFLDMKHGVEAKNYENLGDAAKLKPLEVELKRLEDLSESIVQDFAYMRRREEEMRDTNESTNSRVLYFSIFSMCCLLGLATWQVSLGYYLYFSLSILGLTCRFSISGNISNQRNSSNNDLPERTSTPTNIYQNTGTCLNSFFL